MTDSVPDTDTGTVTQHVTTCPGPAPAPKLYPDIHALTATRSSPVRMPRRALSHAEWGVLQGMLIALGIASLTHPPLMLGLIAIVPAYLLTRKAQARDEGIEAQATGINLMKVLEELGPGKEEIPAPAPVALPPSFEEVRAQARMDTLLDTERELLELKARSEGREMPELQESIEESLKDIQTLKAALELEEQRDLRERAATLQGFIETLKAERR